MASSRGLILVLLASGVHSPLAAQADSATPRSTTERPNMDVPGLQQTISGTLMNAACPAITDERSELTQTGRIVPRTSPNASRRTSERTRAGSPAVTGEVPETYSNCKVSSATTSFAIYSKNKVYMLDRISNQMMQEHMATARPVAGQWIAITVVGTPTSDNVLTLRSIGKR